ncbi:ABC transporter substrate-binding protein [Sneathiella chinensis]|uniref:ABC transporter substrate-binding protein n=1 Tax=Sneathiella chinensis TaxID=349750 RepID=A0ABQ5UAX2_9PROT|nr:ABC transporter substrate-binding protein [Sneathiella chinensis]GLQ07721.1 ABC transporter substrate-binding protein [Sneathiella chinensis]
MKKTFGLLKGAAATALLAATVLSAPMAQAADKTLAVTAIVEHPALDAVHKGIVDELATLGYEQGKNLTVEHQTAQGDIPTTVTIAGKFVGSSPDVIVGISTPSAQAIIAKAPKDQAVVFSAVTDPVAAKLVSNLEKPGDNVTGVSDMSPIKKHLEMVRSIMPDAKKIGVLYNPGEANSISLIDMIEKEAPGLGFEVVKAGANNSGAVLASARSLVGKADAIYVPTDNTIVSAFEAVVKVGIDGKIPVFAGDTDSVKRGAAAALGFNYYALGRQTGQTVAKIFEGANPGDIPVEFPSILELFVNPASAEKMGLTIPESVIASAKEVIQ